MHVDQQLAIARFSYKVLTGEICSPAAVAKGLVGLAVDLVPVEYLSEWLSEESARRAQAIADSIEEAKLKR